MSQRKDFIDFGSPAHAALLGLRKLEKNETVPEGGHEYKGYVLVDETQWGPNARPEFVQVQLVQRVNELTTKPSVPADAQPIWKP